MQLVRLALLLTVPIALVTPPAKASFPGENGPLVLSLETCHEEGPRYLAQVPWRGGSLTPITDQCPSLEDDRRSFEAPYAFPDGRSVLALTSEYVELALDGSVLRSAPWPTHLSVGDFASISPSGRRLVFDGLRRAKPRRYGIWTQRLDGSGVRRIWNGCRWRACYEGYDSPVWSPDGRLLAVELRVRGFARHRDRSVIRDEIALLRVRDGKIVRRLTIHGEEPDWSPDGRWLVYRTPFEQHDSRSAVSGGDLYVVSRDGSEKRLLLRRSKFAETHPTWSPDGRWIAFVSLYGHSEVTVPKLWRIRPRGSSPVKIHDLPVKYGGANPNDPQLTWLSEPVAARAD